MAILLSLAALSIAFLGGWGVVQLLRDPKSHPDPFGVCGTALICGAGLVALSSFGLGLFFQGPWHRAAVISICLAPALYAWRRSQWIRPQIRFDLRLPPLTDSRLTLFAVPAILLSFVIWYSLFRQSLLWDGLFNWESKARVAFLNHGAIPLHFYGPTRDVFHKAYPPLVPVLEAWIYGFLGRDDQSMAKWIGPYFYLAALLLLISVARQKYANRDNVHRESRNGWSAVLVIAPFLLVPSLVLGEGSATSGYADFPLAVIYLCAVVHLTAYWRNGSLASARLAAIAAMLLVFTKSEGIVLLLCLAAAIAPLVVWQRSVLGKAWKIAALMILPGLCLWLGWKAFMRLFHVPQEVDFAGFTPAILASHANLVRPLVSWTLEELTSFRRWSWLWPLTAVAFGLPLLRGRRWQWYPWAAVVFLPLLLYPCTYFFSGWDPVELHVKSSLPRLFIHIAPAAALMVGLVFADLWETRALGWRPRPDLSPEALEALLQEAAALLAPTGITLQHLRDEYQTQQLLEQAADILYPTGLTVEHLQRALQKASGERGPSTRQLGRGGAIR